jgi:hypothetical protein
MEVNEMKRFFKPVNLRSRRAMIRFLSRHFRYDAMDIGHLDNAYACHIKIQSLGLDRETQRRLRAFIDADTAEFPNALRPLFDDFAKMYGYRWQLKLNDRSFIVLQEGGCQPSQYRAYCRECGRLYFTPTKGDSAFCSACGNMAKVNFATPHMEIYSHPSRGVDMGENFKSWDISALRERVRLVQTLDSAADYAVAFLADLVNAYAFTHGDYNMPRPRKGLVLAGFAAMFSNLLKG